MVQSFLVVAQDRLSIGRSLPPSRCVTWGSGRGFGEIPENISSAVKSGVRPGFVVALGDFRFSLPRVCLVQLPLSSRRHCHTASTRTTRSSSETTKRIPRGSQWAMRMPVGRDSPRWLGARASSRSRKLAALVMPSRSAASVQTRASSRSASGDQTTVYFTTGSSSHPGCQPRPCPHPRLPGGALPLRGQGIRIDRRRPE